eukprot:1687027-Amphidinium_carterae.1
MVSAFHKLAWSGSNLQSVVGPLPSLMYYLGMGQKLVNHCWSGRKSVSKGYLPIKSYVLSNAAA